MSRRSSSEDPDFGSDSFLDIIANIVGILIILIVIAGVKVARQPLTSAEATESHDVVVPSVVVAEHPVVPDTRRSEHRTTLTPLHLQLLQDETESESGQTAGLQQETTRLRAQTLELTKQLSRLQKETAEITLEITVSRQQSEESQENFTSLEVETAEADRAIQTLREQSAASAARQREILTRSQQIYDRQSAADTELKKITEQTRKLQELIERQQKKTPPDVNRLKHRLSPVVRTDSQQELHFRLRAGRISWVPIKHLLERLTRQASSRSGVLRRFGRYEGVCGPVGGYSMKYTVERHTPSLLEGLGGTSGGFQVSVSRWTVTPVETLRAEPIDEALRFGSRFRLVTEAAAPDTLMTVWLYPGDFAHFRRLREFGHGLGLRVAARPLPEDAEITGSPAGSRSSGQ